jgi:arylsulfatase A-like enzyme
MPERTMEPSSRAGLGSLTRRVFGALAGSALAAPLVGAQNAKRPNFVIVYTDDQGIGDVGCYGATDVKTPNLDRLAKAGVRFTNWYSNSPVCSPSRASVLTGKYPQKTGIVDVLDSSAKFDIPGLRQGERTLASELKRAGYATAALGKWHLGSAPQSKPMAQGFDSFFGFYSGWTDYYSHRYYKLANGRDITHDLWRNDQEVFEEPGYQTEILAREAESFVGRQSAAKPFFLYLAFGAPHYPMMAPAKYLDRFPSSMDRDRRMHAAMVAAVDDGVGRLTDALKAKGLLQNTVIYFQSDNGATSESRADHAGRFYRGGSNAPFRGWKMGLFEGGIRIPALLSGPGIAPAVVNEPGAAIDVLPTFLSMAGAETPGGIDGLNIAPMLKPGGSSPHDDLFWWYKNQLAIRRGKWKLILNPPQFDQPIKDTLWLSDLERDPSEKNNWASGNEAVVRDLTARLTAWQKSVSPTS